MARKKHHALSDDARFGPVYPVLTGLDKYRRDPDADRHAYGRAVLDAIGALNRRALQRHVPPHRCPCASGVWDSDGAAILRAVGRQNRGRA